MKLNNFNVRVYGLLIENERVLITDEIRLGTKMTKFPGGGLEYGEGLADGLKREFWEEMNIEVEVGELFYINEFLQASSFREEDQLLSVYYLVKHVKGEYKTVEEPFKFETEEPQCFRWMKLSDIVENDFTFPIDKVVAKKLKV